MPRSPVGTQGDAVLRPFAKLRLLREQLGRLGEAEFLPVAYQPAADGENLGGGYPLVEEDDQVVAAPPVRADKQGIEAQALELRWTPLSRPKKCLS